MADLQNTWAQMMNLTQAKVLEKGGFDWRMCAARPAAVVLPAFSTSSIGQPLRPKSEHLTLLCTMLRCSQV